MHNVMGGSVFLYWIGNVIRSSRSPVAEDVRNLGYDIVQIGKDLSTFRRIAESSLSKSSTQRRSSLLLFFCFLYSTMKATESFETSVYIYQSKQINIPENVKTWVFQVSKWLYKVTLRDVWKVIAMSSLAFHYGRHLYCWFETPRAIPHAVFRYIRVICSCTSARFAFHGELPSWGPVPAAWYRVRFWKSWYW
jgi:hypothetical protein